MKSKLLYSFLLSAVLLAACSTGAGMPAAEATSVPPTPQPAEPTSVPPTPQPAEPTNAPDENSLTGTTWQWTVFTNPVEQFDIETPGNYTLTFQEDDTVNIKADCNNAAGSYKVDGKSLSIEIGPMTMAACPPESRSDAFIKYLGYAAIYFFEDGDLFIDLFADGGTMQFSSSK